MAGLDRLGLSGMFSDRKAYNAGRKKKDGIIF